MTAQTENPLMNLPAKERAGLLRRFENAAVEIAPGHPLADAAAAAGVVLTRAPGMGLTADHFREAIGRRDAALDALMDPDAVERLKSASARCGAPPEELLSVFIDALPALLAA